MSKALGGVLIVSLVLGCATASACLTVVGRGPLGPGGDAVTACMVKQHASAMVVGLDVVSNASRDPVTLERASLVGARGVSLAEARVVDVGHVDLFGHANGIPPTRLSSGQRRLILRSAP